MKHHMISCILFILFFVFLSHPVTSIENDNQRSSIIPSINGNVIQTYIVHLAKPNDKEFLGDDELERWHQSFLPNTTLDSGEPRLVYSYSELMTGFAARLTSDEVQAIQHMDGFLHAEPDMQDEPMTTYTPKILGLSDPVNGIWKTQSNMGEGMVIGVIDSGIPPHHSSFGDNQMPAKPMKWKGICNFTNFSCNNKIIGGAMFEGGKKTTPPVDIIGHGSHVASIAAGNFVKDAMVVGKFNYTASGMAPRAHLAIYKVTNNRSDSLKAFEEAISDGVDVINLSMGSNDSTLNFYHDTGAFSGYKAVEKNISISVAAGNFGGAPKSLSHSAPWLTVVGASWPDRRLAAAVRLGNGSEFIGETGLYQPTQFNSSIFLPIVFPGDNNKTQTLDCLKGSLNGINVKDKIVLCRSGKNNVNKGSVVLAAGGAAMILMGPLVNTRNERHVLPVSHVSQGDVQKIIDYYKSAGGSTPTATIIFKGQESGRRPAPAIGRFSSRGPSLTNGGILKPDVIAPGYEILGASPVHGGPFNNYFKYDTGTSMAAPHVAGVMALIKKKYPTWSPAAIQSAIITSADDVDLAGRPFTDMKTWKPADIFARGAGHLNPPKAMDPGLVYDRNFGDYIGYMCGLGYDATTMGLIARRPVNCSTVKKIKASQLNYPSIMVTLNSISPNETVVRTVTNVGSVNSMYTPMITHPANASVILSVNRIQFSAQQPQASFNVTISIMPPAPKKGTISEGKLEWVSNNHIVRSPIAVVFG